MGAELGLTATQVAAFLRERMGGEVSSVEAVAHGEWSRAFLFQHSGGDCVVRFSRFEDDFLKDQRAMAFSSAGLHIPRVLEIGPAFERFYAISERATGDFLEHRDAPGMRRVLPSLFDLLDAERCADVSDTSGYGLWRGSDGCAPYPSWQAALRAISSDPPSSRTAGWRDQLARVSESQRVFEAAYEHMHTFLEACPNERHLVHSDLLNFNVLVRGDQVSAVFDWGSSLYGDWVWDLAWITFWQPWYTDWADVDVRGAARDRFAHVHLEERLRCYELAIGLDGIAYQAFANHWDDLAWTTRRVDGLLQSD